jgi:formamidopyrimidine-DNA glycosylase
VPELPEVETLACQLNHLLSGKRFAEPTVLWSGSLAQPSAEELVKELPGRRIRSIDRRGKFIRFHLSDGLSLLVHLRMSGHLQVCSTSDLADPYARVIMPLTDGQSLVFSDTRKFGRMWLTQDPLQLLCSLGPEPLADEFTIDTLAKILRPHRGALKPLLLNQRVLAGLGNIYTDEILFRAGLHPLRPANGLQQTEVEDLHSSIRAVLQRAVSCRGTTLEDERYRDAEGRPGDNAANLCVYQRDGEPCPACGTVIGRMIVGGRGTHYCPRCQPSPSAPASDSSMTTKGNTTPEGVE